MPTYTFICATCEATVAKTFTLTETVEAPLCPDDNTVMDRKYGMQTIIFRGNGWGKD